MRIALLILGLTAAACAGPPATDPDPLWRGLPSAELPANAGFLLAPGDRLEIIVHTAPELSRQSVVDPDGFIHLPGLAPVTASARPVSAVRADLEAALSAELINPRTDVLLAGLAARSIFVGGEVRSPGLFELPGDIDPVQAILMAGGFTNSAFAQEILIIRKLPEGGMAAELIDLRRGARDASLAAWLPLQRFDILYVPDRRMTEPGLFARRLLREEAPPPFLSFYGIGAPAS